MAERTGHRPGHRSSWLTRDGTRRVEAISLDGKPVLKVTDPRWTVQSRDVLAFVAVLVLGGTLAPGTVAQLRERGVELACLREVPPC